MKKKTFLVFAIVVIAIFGTEQLHAQNNSTLTLNDGTHYWLTPYSINDTISEGDKEDKEFIVTINQSILSLYGFSVHGYGVGFPMYGIMPDESSGGANGNKTISFHFSNRYFPANGKNTKTYSGYIPIHIYYGNERGDSTYLNLLVNLVVKPRK